MVQKLRSEARRFNRTLADIDGVWWSIVVAELMAVVFSAMFLVLKREKYHYF